MNHASLKIAQYKLDFRFDARTSRGQMKQKETFFVRMHNPDTGEVRYAEAPIFRGLSADDTPDFEARLLDACRSHSAPDNSSAIRFAFESLLTPPPPTAWQRGELDIPINGLIWMADKYTMRQRIAEKLDAGFRILKLKIGGIDFNQELELLRYIRSQFSAAELELRLDANGSFTPDEAMQKLDALAAFKVHSIEQPLRAGLISQSAQLCRHTPIPIALDEELIGCRTAMESDQLLRQIMPQYIILKPSLCGGFKAADTYINIAQNLGIGWWATSALESNIGLDAIAAWLATKDIAMPQGLGTGALFHNNVGPQMNIVNCALRRDNPNYSLEHLQWKQ